MILQGDPGKLEMEITGRIYPDITDIESEDGKWLYVDFLVDIPCFMARVYDTHIQIGELQILYNELDKFLSIRDAQDFEVEFWTMEDILLIKARLDRSGTILFDITVQENFNKLSFSLDVDIPSLEQFLNGLFIELRKYTNKLSY